MKEPRNAWRMPGRSGKELPLRPLPLRAGSGPGDRCGISRICLGSPEPDPAPNRHRAPATHFCRSALAALVMLGAVGCNDDATPTPADATSPDAGNVGVDSAGPSDTGNPPMDTTGEPDTPIADVAEDAVPSDTTHDTTQADTTQTDTTQADVPGYGGVPWCDPPVPPPEALRKAGPTDQGHVLPGGRAITPVGVQAPVGGFPVEVRVHPTLPVAYVNNTGKKWKGVQTIDSSTGEVIQSIERDESFYGMALTKSGDALLVSGGRSGLVERYLVGDDGLLEKSGEVDLGGYPAGLALSDDGSKLWVGLFTDDALLQLDAVTLEQELSVALPFGAYAVAGIPGRDEVYVTGYDDTRIAAVDLGTGAVEELEVGGNPLGLAASASGERVFATVCDGDIVIAIDTATRELAGSAPVGEASLASEDGAPLPASSPSELLLDEAHGRLFLSRSADNAVSILDPATLTTTASLPVEWYPTGLALSSDGGTLVVANAKGVSVGPSKLELPDPPDADDGMSGTVSVIDLEGLDLQALSAQVEANVRRPAQVFPFDCDGTFPVPPVSGRPTPIEHIVLIVRENKTYDADLGDLGKGDSDPSLVLFGKDVTPNLHALALAFTTHDNFYNESENSVQGHLWLTASFVTDFVERMRLEGGDTFDAVSATDSGQPDFGTFFMHLLKHDVSFTNFGEVVGAFGEVDGKSVFEHTDVEYPGLFFNQEIKDEVKAQHVIDRLIGQDAFPQFVYILLPNDHTFGTDAGKLAPESMVNDNDHATGMLVSAISHSKYWDSTAIFIVEDDPQTGLDHVEGHRSLCVVVSPWAKRGHNSSVHTSFPSLFRTFELVLDLPPMNRYDANGTALWDAFTTEPDLAPYDVIPRTIEDRYNGAAMDMAAKWSHQMDFSGPDRNPDLGAVLWYHMLGAPPPGSHLARAMAGLVPPVPRKELDEDDVDAYDRGWQKARAYLLAHPDVLARIPAGTLPSALADVEASRAPAPRP